MFVLGTAGHVDHGKSSLVQALTGIDPDRLAEEKSREMTIDLGFAWLRLDGIDEEVGVVDVPGHRDFIENMLAGVGSIDLALFVIAADEGVMPQTREHLAILDLLDIKRGIVAITKVDLIDDEDWLELVELEVSDVLEGTVLESAPMITVSAHTGFGLDQLKSTIVSMLDSAESKPDTGRPRLPIDRVFSITGFGTIVTGTLIGGHLQMGSDIVLEPANIAGRIRGLQTHKTKLELARPGSRVAVNISGVDKNQVKRGYVLTREGVIKPTTLVDTSYRHLADADAPLKHNSEVKFFAGSAEIVARTRIIGAEEILPGEEGWVQLALRSPAAVVRGDRFILRRPSPGATLGGGIVLDPQPGRQHRRFKTDVTNRLETLSQGTPAELVLQTLMRIEPSNQIELQRQTGLESAEFTSALNEAMSDGFILQAGKNYVSNITWNGWLTKTLGLIAAHHKQFPLRIGVPREEIRSRLKLKAVVFNPFVEQAVAQGQLVDTAAKLHLPDHAVVFTEQQKTAIAKLLAEFAQSGINSPSVKQANQAVGEDVFFALVERGDFVQVGKDIVWRQADYVNFIQNIYNYLEKNGTITAAQVRDLLQTSRKYAIGLLEHLDSIRVTRRDGDARVLIKKRG